jgi:succinate-semialdehyde dehydrogenase/glutarate-semialdehyde dehydrogenase
MYIDGAWCGAASGETFEAMDPARGEAFGLVPRGGREDARRAVEAAHRAQERWAAVPLWERADLCIRMAEILESRSGELADMLCRELGKPRYSEAAVEAESFVPVFYRQAAELARYHEGSTFLARDPHKRLATFRRPRGVVAVITPWNFPAMIPSEYIPYAIVMGNTVVWTPAPTAAFTAARLMGFLAEAGLPPGVVNLVTGMGAEVGDELVVNPGTHAVAMTGSTATGEVISSRAGLKPRLLELGGNGPALVLPDADPAKAARTISDACFFAAGQVCSAAERILVAKDLKDEFVDAMVEETGKWVQGDVWNEEVNLGPQNNPGVLEKMETHVEDAVRKGAVVAAGGKRPDLPGYFHQPTVVVDYSLDSLVNTEETFGPIAPIRAFADEDEALEAVRSCPLGLVSSVFTGDLNRAWRWAERLRTGVVVVNDQSNYWEPHVPFGGMSGTRSGVGRLGGRQILEFMSDLQTIAFHLE